MKIIPVITLKQPWASWVMMGLKTIETRTHTRFKELVNTEVGIHSGLSLDHSDYVINNPYLSKEIIIETMKTSPQGVLLGSIFSNEFRELNTTHSMASLIECEATRRYGLLLSDPKSLEKPVPFKGELGVWYVDLDTMQKITKAQYLASKSL